MVLRKEGFQVPGTFSLAFFVLGGELRELSLFIDESGSDNLRDRYYLLTLVLHEQNEDASESIRLYERSLAEKRLPDIPFHASPLLNGHDDYENMDPADRKRFLSSFRVFFRHMPVRYMCITLKTREYDDLEGVTAAMRKRLVDFLFDELAYFQDFDAVKIYYDDGQKSVAQTIHKAVDYALSKDAVTYRLASSSDYRLSQIADYICTMELTALKYADKASTATDEKFFGSWSQFRKGILKEVWAKRI